MPGMCVNSLHPSCAFTRVCWSPVGCCQAKLTRTPVTRDVNTEQLAADCDGWTCADVSALVTEAAMHVRVPLHWTHVIDTPVTLFALPCAVLTPRRCEGLIAMTCLIRRVRRLFGAALKWQR